MRIVLLGAPGSGKGTQAAMLQEELKLPHISTGALLRAAVKKKTEVGLQAKEILDRGDFMPDEIMLHLIEERLAKPDVETSFLLDGYPRNLAQAEALDQLLERLGRPLDEAIQIDVDPERILARILRRAAEEHRSDDSEEVFRHRMEVYEEHTAPVAEYYAERGLLTRILGHGSPEEVHRLLLSVLDLDVQAT
ncbi:MAG: adenylate kinase [Thiohalobacterales bacterium]|nr:adenylate kinase [Thiohalobacterales bacterium]